VLARAEARHAEIEPRRAPVAGHMALAGAGADALARFVEPRWAHATSPTRASQIFADLRLARRALNKAFLDAIAEDTWGPDAP
jgi:hypothetical protein